MESAFIKVRRYNGGMAYCALWTDSDRAEKYDRPLGSKRVGREDEGEAREGYEIVRYLLRGRDEFEYVEPKPMDGLTFEGEEIAGTFGNFLHVEPLANPGWLHCGGIVLATIVCASVDLRGLPWVRTRYISRDHDGALKIAQPA